MNKISISYLKTKPAKAISIAADYPLAIASRNKVKAYLLGKDLYEKVVAYFENMIDRKAVEETDFGESEDFEKVAKELGI